MLTKTTLVRTSNTLRVTRRLSLSRRSAYSLRPMSHSTINASPKISRPQILLLTALNTLNYLDRYLIAAVLPLIMKDLALSNQQGGLVVSAFVIGYCIFSPVFGYLGDRKHRPALMAFGVAVWCLATIATGLTSALSILIFIRIIVGVGEASFAAIAPGYLKDAISNPVALNSTLSLFYVAVPVGSALGYLLGGVMGETWGWQSAFWFGGIPGLFLVGWLFMLPEHRGQHAPPPPLLPGLKDMLGRPILWVAIGGYILNSFALNGLAAFVASYGLTLGFSLTGINSYFGQILVVSGLVGTLVGGRLASKIGRRSPNFIGSLFAFIGIASLLGAPFLLLAFSIADKYIFLGSCFLAALFIFAATAPVNTIIVEACPRHLVTLTQGLTILCLNIFGAFVAPLVVGKIADTFSLQLGLQIVSAAMFLSGIVWLLGVSVSRSPLKRNEHAQQPQNF